MNFPCQNCGVALSRSREDHNLPITCYQCSHENLPPQEEHSERQPSLDRLYVGKLTSAEPAVPDEETLARAKELLAKPRCQQCRSTEHVAEHVFLETFSTSAPAPGIAPLYHPRRSGSTSYTPQKGTLCEECAGRAQQQALGEQFSSALLLAPLGAVICAFAGWKLYQRDSDLWFFPLILGVCLFLAGLNAVLQVILLGYSRSYAASQKLAQLASKQKGQPISDSFGVTSERGATGTIWQKFYLDQLKESENSSRV